MSYKYNPEKEEPEYSERIKLIQQAYEDEGFEWIPDPDKDAETVREIGFLRYSKRNPGSAKQYLLSVYREKGDDGKEWMLWKVKYIVLDKDDRPSEAEVWLGKKPKLDTVPIKNDEGVTVDKRITKWNMKYIQPWDPKVFDKILKEFISTKTNFYLSTTSEEFFQNFGGSSIMIKDRELYRNSSYEDLLKYDQGLAQQNQNSNLSTKSVVGRIH